MTTPPVAQASDIRLSKGRVKFGGPSLTGSVKLTCWRLAAR